MVEKERSNGEEREAPRETARSEKRADGAESTSEVGARFDRRGFFSEGLRSLFKPLARVVEERLDRVGMPEWSSEHRLHDATRSAPRHSRGRSAERGGRSAGSRPPERFLRPPGAIDEDLFLETCLASGQCVRACPVQAIQWARDTGDTRQEGKPFIDPLVQACVVCEDLACMQVCPSRALVPVAKDSIRMGIARVRDEICVRQTGEDCQICVDKCPIGERAIEVPYFGSPVEVHDACTGCGVCEMYCPTEPRAIVVEPRAR